MPVRLDLRAVLCEDVRSEANGKVILIGVYGGNVVVHETPFTIPFYVWVNFSPTELGSLKMQFRVSFRSKKVAHGGATVNVERMEDIAFLLPQFIVHGNEQGELLVEMDQGNGVWETLIRKQVVTDLAALTPAGSID